MLYSSYGALAQLGARHTGSVEVTGSSPVCSSQKALILKAFFVACAEGNQKGNQNICSYPIPTPDNSGIALIIWIFCCTLRLFL